MATTNTDPTPQDKARADWENARIDAATAKARRALADSLAAVKGKQDQALADQAAKGADVTAATDKLERLKTEKKARQGAVDGAQAAKDAADTAAAAAGAAKTAADAKATAAGTALTAATTVLTGDLGFMDPKGKLGDEIGAAQKVLDDANFAKRSADTVVATATADLARQQTLNTAASSQIDALKTESNLEVQFRLLSAEPEGDNGFKPAAPFDAEALEKAIVDAAGAPADSSVTKSPTPAVPAPVKPAAPVGADGSATPH